MDTCPITARSLGLYFKVDGNNLERAYKDHLSGFRNWEQASHAEDWVLHPKNIGKRLGIDETMLHKDLMTFLTNKEGHGKRHTLIAAVKGTKASDIINVLMQIPQEQREQVEEVTMDFSDSMFAVVTAAFPNAVIVIDASISSSVVSKQWRNSASKLNEKHRKHKTRRRPCSKRNLNSW